MRNPRPQRDAQSNLSVVSADSSQLAYASDVQISADSGGVQLTFTRVRSTEGEVSVGGKPLQEHDTTVEVIARVVLPPLAARRLLRLLPNGLDRQQALADEYAQETERGIPMDKSRDWSGDPVGASNDPLLATLAEAEDDDEPYPDEQRAAANIGWEEYARGETVSWEKVKRELFEDDASALSKS